MTDGLMLGAMVGAGIGVSNAIVRTITGTGYVDYVMSNTGLGFNGGQ
tara:strand:- start:1914 stop:2054 length:141 start_codon:yes stop_codon:yes gene_type:complete